MRKSRIEERIGSIIFVPNWQWRCLPGKHEVGNCQTVPYSMFEVPISTSTSINEYHHSKTQSAHTHHVKINSDMHLFNAIINIYAVYITNNDIKYSVIKYRNLRSYDWHKRLL